MSDKFTKEVRSKIMSRIRSKWTKNEKKIHNFLKGHKIKHTMHPKLPGNPDAFFPESNAVLFIDGCFWHGCPTHGHYPKSNKKYWHPKLKRNILRDKKYNEKLKKLGYKVVRVWEHEVSSKDFDFKKFLQKIF